MPASPARAKLSRVSATLDCQTCGACCCNPDENRDEKFIDYVEILSREPLLRQPPRLLKRLTIVNKSGERHMKMVGREQRCIALDGEVGEGVSCKIYELRPAPCRRLKAGSPECLRDRREKGLEIGDTI